MPIWPIISSQVWLIRKHPPMSLWPYWACFQTAFVQVLTSLISWEQSWRVLNLSFWPTCINGMPVLSGLSFIISLLYNTQELQWHHFLIRKNIYNLLIVIWRGNGQKPLSSVSFCYQEGVDLPISWFMVSLCLILEGGSNNEKGVFMQGRGILQSQGQSGVPGRWQHVQIDDMLENMAFFMSFGNDKLDKKLKRQNSTVRRLITTKALVNGKYLVTKERLSVSQIMLEDRLAWRQMCLTCLEPFSHHTESKLN